MKVLKKYVHNRSHSEGCITKGYRIEEVIEFCVDFIDDLSPIGIPKSRQEGRLKGKGTLGEKNLICISVTMKSVKKTSRFYIIHP
jgi:hypothetical protein